MIPSPPTDPPPNGNVEMSVRVFNSFLELGEFTSRQAPVFVVIEPLDEMYRTIFGELELVLQYRCCLGEAYVLSPASQTHLSIHDVFKSITTSNLAVAWKSDNA